MRKEKASEKGKAWLKREMRPYRASIVFITIISVLTTLSSLAFAYLVRYLVGGAIERNVDSIVLISCILLAILAVKIISSVLYSYFTERQRCKMIAKERKKIYGRLLHSDYEKLAEFHSGDLLNRITSDLTEVVVDTVSLTPTLVGIGVQCVGAIAALLTLDPLFTAIYVVCGAFGGGLMAIFRKRVKHYHKEFMVIDGDARSFMQEGLTSLLTIKAYNAENRMYAQNSQYSSLYYRARMKRNKLRTFMSSLTHLLGNVGLIFAIIWCSVRLLNSEIDFGVMLSVVLLLNQLQHPFSSVSSVIPVIFSRQASAERLYEITALATSKKKETMPTIDYSKMRTINVENVSFNYGEEHVLDDVSISFKKGENVCIIGNSGSGKSTLFKILLGVFAPAEGKISVEMEDGEKIAFRGNHSGLFAYVPQGNFLFSGTIRENLLFFASEDVSDEEIYKALKIAQAEFVFDFPDGLEKQISERGIGLSEGQQQRLTIARALLSGRPVLLLDEATSALDSATEKNLLEAIKQLENKTCILVTHRPAALEMADSVYEIIGGKISARSN